MSGNEEYNRTNDAANVRYHAAQDAKGGTTGEDRLDKVTEEYLGRLEDKYNRLEHGQEDTVDSGHQQQINNLGNAFRKTANLPKYKQSDPTGRN